MSLLFMDGFETTSGSSADLLRKWTNATVTGGSLPTGRISGKAIAGSSTVTLTKTLSASYATLVAGCGWKIGSSAPSSLRVILAFYDSAGSQQVGLYWLTNGLLAVYAGAGATLLGTTAVSVTDGMWYYIEFKATIHNTTGAYEVRVNGVNILSATGQNTRHASSVLNSAAGVQVGAASAPWTVDDFYICDTAGSVNNDFLGDIQVYDVLPSGAGSNTNFTPSAGSNYACVDDAAGAVADDDTTYVEHATAATRDTYAFANLPAATTAVKGVQTCILARKTDSGSKTLGDSCKSGVTTSDGTAASLGVNYQYLLNIRETDPNTAAAWTLSGFDAAEFGQKVGA